MCSTEEKSTVSWPGRRPGQRCEIPDGRFRRRGAPHTARYIEVRYFGPITAHVVDTYALEIHLPVQWLGDARVALAHHRYTSPLPLPREIGKRSHSVNRPRTRPGRESDVSLLSRLSFYNVALGAPELSAFCRCVSVGRALWQTRPLIGIFANNYFGLIITNICLSARREKIGRIHVTMTQPSAFWLKEIEFVS